MNLGVRLSRLETIVGKGLVSVLIDAEDDASALRLLEDAILAADGPTRVTIRIAGEPDGTILVGHQSHEDRLADMEAM